MQLDEDVDLKKIAEETHSYLGSDLADVCREAALESIRDRCKKIEEAKKKNGEDVSNPEEEQDSYDLKVREWNFYKALIKIESSFKREDIFTIPKTTFDDIGGLK